MYTYNKIHMQVSPTTCYYCFVHGHDLHSSGGLCECSITLKLISLNDADPLINDIPKYSSHFRVYLVLASLAPFKPIRYAVCAGVLGRVKPISRVVPLKEL